MHNNLSADQQLTLANGMYTAAAKYRECAAAMRQEAARLAAIQTPNAAAECAAALAGRFDEQAIDAAALAEIIEQATDVGIVF